MNYTKWLIDTDISEVSLVGGKNASLGEMMKNLSYLDIRVPNGFVITTDAYISFLQHNNLIDSINCILNSIDYDDNVSLRRETQKIRMLIQNGSYLSVLVEEIMDKYRELSNEYKQNETDVAIRSSATAEDTKEASFAGQQDTYLNVRGKDQVLEKIKSCFASIYNDRAVDYRKTMNMEQNVKISICVQKMVRSDLSSSGVAFSIDTESGNNNVVVINSSYGLGEMIVGGQIVPDEFMVFKPTLNNSYLSIIDKKLGNKTQKMIYSDNHDKRTKLVHVDNERCNNFSLDDVKILQLAKWVCNIENHYSERNGKYTPIDVEWAVDGITNNLYIVQARPETVQSNKNINTLITYKIDKSDNPNIIARGVSIGDKISSGSVKIMFNLDTRDTNIQFNKGDILVTEITDPDWEPLMKKAGAIITERGGRTCHAAIVARELGVPAIVGVENITSILENNQIVTCSCAEGDVGFIYDGKVNYELIETNISNLPKLPTKIMMNVASPDQAFLFSKIPNYGVGLAREEFIINNFIKIHPLALLHMDKVLDKDIQNSINKIIHGYASPKDFFIKKLSYGIARIAAAFYPNEVIVRFSDFKSNEYVNLLGGKYFEPTEENPMIGWRGASRYYSETYEEAFGLECESIKYVREIMGLNNVIVMIPFCRTVEECKLVLETMKKYGLERGINGLQVYIMCEIPSNVILADEFCKYVDGFSIGSNDLTQLTLGLDRDSSLVSHVYNERNPAVKYMISWAIKTCKKNGVKIGICGQAPSDYIDFAQFLIEEGIDSISLTPDSVLKTWFKLNEILHIK